jgi:hypothetical protein
MRISFLRKCMCWFRQSMVVFELTGRVCASLALNKDAHMGTKATGVNF